MSQGYAYRSLALPAKLAALGSLLALNNVGVSAHPICHEHYFGCQGPVCGIFGIRRDVYQTHCFDPDTGQEFAVGDPYLGECCQGPVSV